MQAAAREERARPVAVVACAQTDASALTAVVRGLVARKMRVDFVPVTDTSVAALEAAVERYGDAASYVVCHTPALDRYTADLCDLTIRAGEVPDDKIVSAWFDPAEPEAFASSVWHWAQEDDQLKGIRQVFAAVEASTPSVPKAPPRVAVHTPPPAAANEAASSRSMGASSTRVAMRMALGWRRVVNPAAMFLLCFGLAFVGLYYSGIVQRLTEG